MKLAPSKISIVSFVTSLAMLSLSSWTIANADGGYAVVDADGRVCGVIVATSADPFGNGGFMPIEYMGCPAGSRIIFQTNRSPDGNVAGYGAGGGTTYNEETKIFTVSSTSPDGSSKTEIAIKDGVATSASTGESFDTGSGVEVETALSPVELVKLVLQGGGLSEKDLSRLSDKSTNDILAQNIVDLVNKGGTVSSTKLDLLNGENKDLILVKVTQSIVNSLKNGDAVNRTNLEILSEVHLDSVLTESREQVSRETASLSSDAARKAGELSKKTPGIQRCVSWSGFGTSGKECATYNPGTSETLTVTSFKASSETSTATTAGSASSETSTATTAGSASSETSTATTAGSASSETSTATTAGSASSETSTATTAGSASSETSTATTAGSASSETSTATTAGSASSETSTVSSDTKGKDETLNQINKVLDTLKGSSATSTDVIVVKSTPSEVKTILKEVVPTANEISAITNGISKFDSIRSQTYSSQHSLPSLRNVEESYTSLTPNVCAIEGNTAVSKSGGICSIEITVKDSLGNSFKTVKEVNFRKLSSSKKP